MKSLIFKYTIGCTNAYGLDCLKRSVKNIKRFYPAARIVVCCNNNSGETIKELNIECEILDQQQFAFCLPNRYPRGINPAYKLYPPRIDINSHEIMIDNDLIIYDKSIIDAFLESQNEIWITAAPARSYSKLFNLKIRSDFQVNTGLICMPPNYDLADKIKQTMLQNRFEWKEHLDEQGLLAFIFQFEPNLKIISLNDIFVCRDKFGMGRCGIHFVSLNKGSNAFYKNFLAQHL